MRWERNRLAIAGVVVLATFAAACSSSSSSGSSTAVGTTSASTSTSTSASSSSSSSGGDVSDVSGKSTFDISAQNFFFTPSELDGTAGQSLKLTVTNEGSVPHTFTIDSQKVDVTLPPGQSQQITVTFPTSGSVEFYCKFHVSSGMKGTLKVV